MTHWKHIAPMFLFLLGASILHATHNYSGEIIFRKTGPLTIEATIVTYTKASAVSADRDSLELCWGDGHCQMVARTNGAGLPLGNDLKMNLYTAMHTYAIEASYVLSMTDYNRTANIININPPYSDNVPFHLESMVQLMPFDLDFSSSPRFLLPPVDIGAIFQPFNFTPNAYDADGDSLAYELISPMGEGGGPVPNYSFPDQIAPSDDNKVTFNPLTGDFNWTTPILPGEYCIAIKVSAYRNGVVAEYVVRDMMIFVQSQPNHPPLIALNPDYPSEEVVDVYVGQTIGIDVNASDPDPGQTLTLSATGGPFEDPFQEKAQFTATGNTGHLTWHVAQEFLRDQPYQVVFKAKDNYLGNGLASSRIIRFRVLEALDATNPAVQTLRLYPNPSSGVFYVETPAAGNLRIIDTGGRLVRINAVSGDQPAIRLDLEGYPAGMYWLELVQENGVKSVAKLRKE